MLGEQHGFEEGFENTLDWVDNPGVIGLVKRIIRLRNDWLRVETMKNYTRAGVTSSLNLTIGHYAGGMKREP